MKKIIFLTFSIIISGVCVKAQPGRQLEKAQERIEAMKVAFITERLQLTPEEAQGFWPIYNQYQDEQEAMRRKYRSEEPVENLSDSEAEVLIKDHLVLEQKELDLKKAYIDRLKKVISPRKIALLNTAEREFKARLIERIRDRRPGRVDRQKN